MNSHAKAICWRAASWTAVWLVSVLFIVSIVTGS